MPRTSQFLPRLRAMLPFAAATLLLAGCGSDRDADLAIATIGAPSSPFDAGPRLSPAAQLTRAATVEGLVAFDAEGRVVPALADRWIVTDDGASYIFRLRDGVWRDGSAITSQSARTALQQAIAALKGTALAIDLAQISDIRVMAGRVIEIRLSQPNPDLLHLLAQPEMGLVHKGRGAGPMQMSRVSRTARLTVIPPKERGLPDIEDWKDRTRNLQLTALPARTAVEQFNRGEVDVLFGGRFEHFPNARLVGISRGTIQLDPVSGLFGLIVVSSQGFLAEAENREVIAMAIDRENLLQQFGLDGWVPTTRVVAPGLDGDLGTIGERWAGQSLEARRGAAAARVSRWKAKNGGESRLRIAMPVGPGSDMVFDRLKADFGLVGLDVARVGEASPADLRLLDVVARYGRPSWFLNQLSCAAKRGLCSSDADQRAAEARAAADPAERAALLTEAEVELTTANVFIPFGAPIRWSLVRGDVAGFFVNRWNVHPLMPLAWPPK